MPLFPAAGPRCRFSRAAPAANFRLRTLSPRFSLLLHHFSSARGVRGIAVPLLVLTGRSPLCQPFKHFPAASCQRTFASSVIMASRIDGTAIAKSIREGLKAEIEKTQQTNPRFKPNLVIFQGKQLRQWSCNETAVTIG